MNFAKDRSSRFHRELDLAKLRAFRETLLDPPDEHFAGLPEEERASMRAEFAEDLAALDVVIARDGDCPDGTIPCDVFKFMEGDAPNREMTKLGGLPYWPADRRWPTNWRGQPLSFLGQINFRDSRDVVFHLPGEILVMFINGHDSVISYWLDPTDAPLIADDRVPNYERKFGPSYGVIHRTYDVPERPLEKEVGARFGVAMSVFDLKIGGAPWGHGRYAPSPERFLFQMESPFEVFEDNVFGGSFAIVKDFKWRWPFTKRDDSEATEVHLSWWAAHMKRNGKLQWSWA